MKYVLFCAFFFLGCVSITKAPYRNLSDNERENKIETVENCLSDEMENFREACGDQSWGFPGASERFVQCMAVRCALENVNQCGGFNAPFLDYDCGSYLEDYD